MTLVDLRAILAASAPRLDTESYVFTRIPHDAPVPLTAISMMREDEGISLVMLERDAIALGLPMDFPCNLITLRVESSLYAVGFLAEITRELAKAGISVSPVSAFHHDHLFVPRDRAEEAFEILTSLARRAMGSRSA